MSWKKIYHHSLAPWGLPILGLFLLLVAWGRATPAIPSLTELLGWSALAVLAASYRPWGGTLGVGTLVLPAVILRQGVMAAVLVAMVTFLAAEALRRLPWRRARRRSWVGDAFRQALLVGLAVLVSQWVEGWSQVLIYASTFLLLLLIQEKIATIRDRESPSRRQILGILGALSLDVTGWLLGLLLANVALEVGWLRSLPFAVALSLALAEASRLAAQRQSVEARRDDLERLQHAHRRILAEVSGMGGIAQQILTECLNILPVQWFQFELLKADGGQSWSAGPDGVLVEGEPRPATRPPALPGVHRRAEWRILEVDLRTPPDPSERRTPRFRESQAGQILATLRLWCDPRRVEPEAEALFATLTPQMAASLHRAQLDREAKLDPLTGVPVRRMLETRLQRAYRVCCEEGWSMAVLMCDIDFFKKINDTYGHAAGDAALVAFAQTLDSHRRENDLCCRYGGEEFTLLLESTPGDAALGLAERLRLAVEALEVVYEGQRIPLTMSVGIAAFPELHIKTASELLLLADEALYEAKEQGRNRCLLNLGKGAFRASTGPVFRTKDAPSSPSVPRVLG